MSFVSIISAIETILNTISDVAEVQNFDKGELKSFPAVVIFPSENTNEFATTVQNRREFIFTLRVHYPMKEAGDDSHQRADRILRQTVDAIIDELDNKFSLNGAVNFCFASPSLWGYQTRESGAIRVAEIRLVCVKLDTVLP